MLIQNENEVLVDVRGNANINFDTLVAQAQVMDTCWEDRIAVYDGYHPAVRLTDHATSLYTDRRGVVHEHDITAHMLSQLCNKSGIPSEYIAKCILNGKEELAAQNFNTWAYDSPALKQDLVVKHFYDQHNADHAMVSFNYHTYNAGQALSELQEALDRPEFADRYEANQAFLSPDHMHIRFVDFNNPITIGGDTLHAGFIVTSDDIGRGALTMKYFLYRFVCKNGLVVSKGNVALFRQTHLRDFSNVGPQLFVNRLNEIDAINGEVQQNVEKAMMRRITREELEHLMKTAQQELHFGKAGKENILSLLESTYTDNTYWSFINAITEDAQRYTLSGRLASETFAGKLLAAA